MSSVLIKGMKMPKGCLECPFKDIGMSTMTQCLLVAGWVEYANDGYGIPDACPLVGLPEKHGRLIEEPKYFDYNGLAMIAPLDFKGTAEYFARQVKAQPTIIEAEGDEG